MNRSVKFLTVEGIQKRKVPEKHYVYVLKVVWSDGTINIVYRKCSDFFRLQEDLKTKFPDVVAGSQIPALKGRKFSENCKFCFKDGSCKRMSFLNQFCHELINAAVRISKSDIVLGFCKPNHEDLNPRVPKKDKKKNKGSGKKEQGAEVISSPVVFEQHIAVADYKKKCKNDINLDAGDIVDVIEKNEYGWWLVDREGELGWAPASYLEPMDEVTEDTITTQIFGPGEEEVYMSMKEHKAEAEDEISFDVGVMLQVLQKTLDGWWLVRYHGREGWAPAMVLKKIDNNTEKKKKISVTTGLRSDRELDIVAFGGETESGGKKEFMQRTPPARRNTVRKTIKHRPRYRIENDGSVAENPIVGDLQAKSSRHSSYSNPDEKEEATKLRSGSSTPTYSPSGSPRTRTRRLSPQVQGPAIPKNLSHSEIETYFRSQHLSASSSGYDSSTWGSMNSVEEPEDSGDRPYDTVSEQIRSIPRRRLGMRRIHSSSELTLNPDMDGSLARERNRASTLSNGTSRSLQQLGREISAASRPVPKPRKISLTQSPLASEGIPERSASPVKSSSLERDQQAQSANSTSDSDSSESDMSDATISGAEESLPKEESSESNDEPEESSPRNSKCYSPNQDTVFNGTSQQHEINKENKANNEQETNKGRAESPRYRATSCYFGEDEGELRFNEGEIIEVIQKAESGWWFLKAKGGVGWGPSTYLEVLDTINDNDTKL